MTEPTKQGAGGGLANEVEGYLLWQARVAEAEQRAREFVRPMDWLTTAQRTEIEQHYVAESLRRAQQDLERIAARCVSLRAEYEQRY
ncbi:cytochrome C oxidase subunit I, partial [Streptomyces sp. NPDC004561]